MHWDPWAPAPPAEETYSTRSPLQSRRKSSVVPGASKLHHAIHPTSATTLDNNILSFLSYVKTQNIPILPVTKPDIRSVLGQGASFLVNGAEVPRKYIDPVSGNVFPQGMVVAFKRAVGDQKYAKDREELIAVRIHILFNELLTMHHPPLRAHPNIVKLLGVGLEIEGESNALNAMPVLIPECAELGNLAEVLETARKEDRPLKFETKISLCLDIAHGIEILHACDIVHGDVKCENVLIFEREIDSVNEENDESRLYCKLTDFGVSRLPEERVQLGGSYPWQAPECSHAALFGIEDAKRTDMYSFGMLLWRVMLDGDPFKSLGEFHGATAREKRQARNDAIAALKEKDRLVQHVCESLALSERFTKPQIHMLSEVMSTTLLKESSKRELDITRIIRLLTPNQWFEARRPVPPARMPLVADANLLDLEKWHSEFESVSPVVQQLVFAGFRNYAQDQPEPKAANVEEKQSAAAYQVAICYANGFGVPAQPEECLRWLNFAAGLGSQKAQEAIPSISRALNMHTPEFADPWTKIDDAFSVLSCSWTSADFAETGTQTRPNASRQQSLTKVTTTAHPTLSYFAAAENGRYDVLETLLSSDVKPKTSPDGVSPIHFLSSWNLAKAENLGQKLVAAGAEINAHAMRGPTVGGTPLMWSVFGNHIEHSLILMRLGADPMAATDDGEDALSFAARLHLTSHLQILLENIRPVLFRKHIHRLLEAAAGGVSRFARMVRHGSAWDTAANNTFELLRKWNELLTDTEDFESLLLPAIESAIKSPYGRMNTEVQMSLIRKAKNNPKTLESLLRDAVLTYNVELFNALLQYGVPIDGLNEEGKNLLHLCTRIPDHNLAAVSFALPLIRRGLPIDERDFGKVTPWMESILERKWDLADVLMDHGADPLLADSSGFNVMGLCIKTLNLGAVKYLLKYCNVKDKFQQECFIVNHDKNISALQLAAALTLPRAHGMKLEVMGLFLVILGHYSLEPWQLDFRSDGILPHASALDIAASMGSVHAVKNLVKKGALRNSSVSALKLVQEILARPETTGYMERKNLERCAFIIENWETDMERTRKVADDWTNMRTIDESHVNSSWEIVIFDYKTRKGVVEAS